MILALAITGLSASLVAEKFCDKNSCYIALTAFGDDEGVRLGRYSIFLGLYGIVVAAVGIASLFVDSIPLTIPLVGDSIGALFYLAGGIAWAVKLRNLNIYCSEIPKWFKLVFPDAWFADDLVGTCRRCEADHGLVWSMFAFTTGLVICDYFRRRNRIQSYN